MNWKHFIPIDGKGWGFFAIAALPVIIAGINSAMNWREWAALPFAVALAGLNATKAYNSTPQNPNQPNP